MKILLDHCVPRPFEKLLPGHEVIHTSRMGWDLLENGKLLAAAEAEGFDVMITVDQNMSYQQTLQGRKIAILLLRAVSNSIPSLKPLIDQSMSELPNLEPGQIIVISMEKSHG
jgi:predicted nuclease of predicted toxin-antitoxin system